MESHTKPPPLGTAATTTQTSTVHHYTYRRTYSERCKVGRALAAQWMTLSVSSSVTTIGNSNSAPTPASTTTTSTVSHSSFLDALKRVPPSPTTHQHHSSMADSLGDTDSPAGPSPNVPNHHNNNGPSSSAHYLGAKVSPLVAIDECFQEGILSILREIALSGAALPDLGGSSSTPDLASHRHSGGGVEVVSDNSRVSPASLEDPSPTYQLPSTPPLRPMATTASAKKAAAINGAGYPASATTSPANGPITSGVVVQGTPVLPSNVASSARGPPRRPPLTPLKEPDMEHWKDIKEKLLHLRTQIRNREEFDAGLFRLFGDEWSRTVRDGSVEDEGVGMFEGSVTSIDGERYSPSTLVSGGARRTPGGTAPPSPIGTQGDEDFKERSLGTSPPPSASVPPPLLGGRPSPQHTNNNGYPPARFSPPPAPSITPPLGSGGPIVNSSPVTSRVAGYHLESRDDMLRRRNNSMNGSVSSFSSSMTGGGGGGYHTPKNRSLSNSPLMGPMMGPGLPPGLLAVNSLAGGNTMLCPFDYILVIDFEATCDEPNPPNFLHEIIEFPVVVVDVQLRRVCMEFHSFVRPMMHPILSPFCKQLTGIRQEEVDTAPTLPEVIRRFEVWFKNSFPPHARVIFATDGPWDMRDFMYNHSHKRSGVHFPQLFYQWVDVKQAFANFFHMNRQRIVRMLEYLGLPHEGRLHSGIDDSRNIARIVIGLLIRGCSLCDIDRLPYLGAPASIDSTTTASTSSASGTSSSS